ncbi:hypothetical protein GGR57DRAFT_299917 [Xylariaceae sp. FL1272]|nr:hypothetical protein GGR57DRAFT_299917 [Xylariaceae sp. FL1272]
MDAVSVLLGNPHTANARHNAISEGVDEANSEVEARSAAVKEIDATPDAAATNPGADEAMAFGSVPISTSQSPPTIIHIRDSYLITSEWAHGRRLLRRLRDAVKTRREKGENFVVLISVTHADAHDDRVNTPDPKERWMVESCQCWMCQCHDPLACTRSYCELGMTKRKLDLADTYTRMLMPSAVPTDWPEPIGHRHEKRIFGWSTGSVKRLLRSKLCHYEMTPPTLLEDSYDWSEFLSQDAINYLSSRAFSIGETVLNATVPLIGRYVRRRTLQAEDIQVLLARIQPDNTIEQEQGRDEEAEIEGPKEAEQRAWKEKIEEIEKACGKKGKELLARVVNPVELASSFDEVVLDQEVIR